MNDRAMIVVWDDGRWFHCNGCGKETWVLYRTSNYEYLCKNCISIMTCWIPLISCAWDHYYIVDMDHAKYIMHEYEHTLSDQIIPYITLQKL